jgi:hypothetical protein
MDYHLPDNAKLVMIAKETFTWNPRKKHQNIIVTKLFALIIVSFQMGI